MGIFFPDLLTLKIDNISRNLFGPHLHTQIHAYLLSQLKTYDSRTKYNLSKSLVFIVGHANKRLIFLSLVDHFCDMPNEVGSPGSAAYGVYKLSFNTTVCTILVLNVAHTSICGLGGALRIYLHDLLINFFSGLILLLLNKASHVYI